MGSSASHEGICRAIANRADAVVFAPDYQLAPEYSFPNGLIDCVSAHRYVHENAANLGIDPSNIAVAGDSAGGNLATVLSLMARDQNIPAIAAHILIYPNTDQAQSTNSFSKFKRGFGLSAADMAWFRNHYLPDPNLWSNWKAAPLLAPSLHNVAPAVVV